MMIAVVASVAQAQPAETKQKAGAHFKQGEAYWKVKAYDRAIKEYEAAYALVPKPGFLFNIGLCHEELNDKVKALEHYQRYLADAPEGRKATEARARSVQLERDIERARVAAAQARARDAEAAKHQLAIAEKVGEAETAAGAGRYDAAVEAYRAAHEMSSDAEMLFRIAETYELKGDTEEALVHYETYLARAPAGASSVDARLRLKQLRDAATAVQRQLTTHIQTTAPPAPRKPQRWSLGVKAGLNRSKPGFFTKDDEADTCETPRFVVSGEFGVSGTFAVTDHFGVQAELLFIQKSMDVDCATQILRLDTEYLEIPVLARLTQAVSWGGFALYAGGLIGFTYGEVDQNAPGVVFEEPGPELGWAIGAELGFWSGPGQILFDARFVGTDQKYFATGGETLEIETEATMMLMVGYAYRPR